jgi:hypothetical protein
VGWLVGGWVGGLEQSVGLWVGWSVGSQSVVWLVGGWVGWLVGGLGQSVGV